VGKPEERGAFGRPRHRREDGIETDFQEIEWGRGLNFSGFGWEELAGYSVVDLKVGLLDPQGTTTSF
jgi:hypothetical protein